MAQRLTRAASLGELPGAAIDAAALARAGAESAVGGAASLLPRALSGALGGALAVAVR